VRLAEWVYESFVQKYGVSEFTMKKFKQLLGSLLRFRESVARVRLFSMFVGLSEEVDEIDFDFYIKANEFMHSQ
jgi:hypothetical protein